MNTSRPHRRLVTLLLGLAVLIGCGKTQPPSPPKKTSSAETSPKSPAVSQPSQPKLAPKEILDQMARAYKYARTYADAGRLRLEFEGQQPSEFGLVTALVRPNRLRFHSERADVVCDGKDFRAFVTAMPGTVLQRPAPALLSPKDLLADVVLAEQLANGPEQSCTWLPVPLVLLFADDPLKTLLHAASETRALGDANIDQFACHRVEITRPDGKAVLWIDQKTFILRRFEDPVGMLRTMMGMAGDAELSLGADFTDAQLDGPVDPNAFQFEASPDVKTTAKLMPAEIDVLGKQAGDFIFVDLDNKPTTRASLDDKIVVMEFWATWCKPCRQTLPLFQKLYERYRDNDKIQFMAVSIDESSVADADLKKMFKELGVTAPLYRDWQRHAISALGVGAVPTCVVLGPKGIVQSCRRLEDSLAVSKLERDVETVVAGKDAFPETVKVHQETMAEFDRLFDEMVRRDLFIDPMALLTAAGERKEPGQMRLTRLWTCDALKSPGNLLVLSEADAPSRALVLDEAKDVVELDARGAVVARHKLDLPPGDQVAFLRTAMGADGRRCYVGSASGAQQFHLFDENWKRVSSFPAAAKEPHAGIGDAQLGDLDGDGKPEVYVGYRGVIGVKGVSLAGDVLWSERSVADVFKMAIGQMKDDGASRLFCTNNQTTLVALDGKGKVVGRVERPDGLLYWIAAADLDRDGQAELCGFTAPKMGQNLALGLSSDGHITWNYKLPDGLPGPFVELVTPAWLKPGEPGQWVLLGADGSLHVLSAKGELLDWFNHGELITGVAFTQIDGKPALLISTRGKVEAWSGAWPEKTPPAK